MLYLCHGEGSSNHSQVQHKPIHVAVTAEAIQHSRSATTGHYMHSRVSAVKERGEPHSVLFLLRPQLTSKKGLKVRPTAVERSRVGVEMHCVYLPSLSPHSPPLPPLPSPFILRLSTLCCLCRLWLKSSLSLLLTVGLSCVLSLRAQLLIAVTDECLAHHTFLLPPSFLRISSLSVSEEERVRAR